MPSVIYPAEGRPTPSTAQLARLRVRTGKRRQHGDQRGAFAHSCRDRRSGRSKASNPRPAAAGDGLTTEHVRPGLPRRCRAKGGLPCGSLLRPARARSAFHAGSVIPFFVAALRVLTEAVVRSLHEHGRIVRRGDVGTSDLVRIECDLFRGDRAGARAGRPPTLPHRRKAAAWSRAERRRANGSSVSDLRCAGAETHSSVWVAPTGGSVHAQAAARLRHPPSEAVRWRLREGHGGSNPSPLGRC